MAQTRSPQSSVSSGQQHLWGVRREGEGGGEERERERERREREERGEEERGRGGIAEWRKRG